MGRGYRRRYYRLFYSKVWLRRSVADRVKRLCEAIGLPLSDCVDHLVDLYGSVTGTVVP